MAEFLVELVLNIIAYLCYPLGWLFLRIIAFGNYPLRQSRQKERQLLFFSPSKWKEEEKITLVGFLVLLAAFVIFVIVKNADGQ